MVYYLLARLQNYHNTPQSQWSATSPQLHNQTAYPATRMHRLIDDFGYANFLEQHKTL
jgi:hypothetical protein